MCRLFLFQVIEERYKADRKILGHVRLHSYPTLTTLEAQATAPRMTNSSSSSLFSSDSSSTITMKEMPPVKGYLKAVFKNMQSKFSYRRPSCVTGFDISSAKGSTSKNLNSNGNDKKSMKPVSLNTGSIASDTKFAKASVKQGWSAPTATKPCLGGW